MNEILREPWFPAALAFLIGAGVGRLLNRGVDVFPRHEALADQLRALFVATPSERKLRQSRAVWHRLPIIGWLAPSNPLAHARGRFRYAAVELANALLFAAVTWAELPHGLETGVADPFGVPDLTLLAPADSLSLQLIRLGLHLVLVAALLVASTIDLERMIIPDGSTVPVMLLALIVSTAAGGVWLVPVWYEHAGLMALLAMGDDFGGGLQVPAFLMEHPHLHGFLVSLMGLIVGGAVVWAVRLIGHWALGREAMGFGDVILMAAIGSVIGWQPVIVVFFLAPICAIAIVLATALTGTSREFPYGPWLSLAAVLLLVAWQSIWPYAGQFFLMGRLMPFLAGSILILLAILLRGMRLIRGDDRWFESSNGAWSSADQLLYQSQENQEPGRNSWRGGQDGRWPGIASARGSLASDRWRTPFHSRPANWQNRRNA